MTNDKGRGIKWNVYMEDFNDREIKEFNIFNHYGFREQARKLVKKYKEKEEFAEQLRKWLMYYFWSKCEYEIILTDFPTFIDVKELQRLNAEYDKRINKSGKICVNLSIGNKIDVYDQVRLNWEAFVDYVWLHKKEI